MNRLLSKLFHGAAAIGFTIAVLLAAGAFAQTKTAAIKAFASPEDAISALVDAAKAKDANVFVGIFGPALKQWIVSGDRVEDENRLDRFVAAYQQKRMISRQGEDKALLAIGNDDFPFPFPIVKTGAGWVFDAEAGKQEMLNRRIGENELETIEVMKAIVDAQRDYAALARKVTGATQYAQRFMSSAGKKNGLYWPQKAGEPESPLGPLVAEAQREGYEPAQGGQPTPYHGYYYKMLTAQGPQARGGAYEYVVNGKMIGGFAVLAYPARYGISGFKSFVVNHDGVVYEADLGPNTSASAPVKRAFNPDERWKKL